MDNQQVRPLIKEFPLNHKYKVSTDGTIYGVKGIKLKGKDHRGYRRYVISIDGKPKAILGHRIVAITFLDNPNNLPEVNHKDGNKSNNNVDNLEWVSREENQLHAFATGLNSKVGSLNGRAIIDEEYARYLYLQMLEGKTPKKLSDETNIPKNVLIKLRNKVTWLEVTEDLPDCQRLTVEKHKRTTDVHRKMVIHLKNDGKSNKEISSILNLTLSQVEHVITDYNKGKLQRLGISRTPKQVEVVSSQ